MGFIIDFDLQRLRTKNEEKLKTRKNRFFFQDNQKLYTESEPKTVIFKGNGNGIDCKYFIVRGKASKNSIFKEHVYERALFFAHFKTNSIKDFSNYAGYGCIYEVFSLSNDYHGH